MNLELLNTVTEEFASYLSEAGDGDLTAPTPCALWTIEDLFAHMLEANVRLAAALDPHATPPASRGVYALRETIYRDSARYAAEALAGAGTGAIRAAVSDGGPSPEDLFESHVANTLIHTWDLAQATQLDFERPSPQAVDIALRYLHRLPPESRGQGRLFAEIRDFPAAAPMDEVVFLSGRGLSG